jgi:hypothetical protein
MHFRSERVLRMDVTDAPVITSIREPVQPWPEWRLGTANAISLAVIMKSLERRK